MEKLDIAVAAGGALVLLVAIVGAALTDGSGGVEYDVVFSEAVKAGAPVALDLAAGHANATFEVPDLNVTKVTVKVYVNATASNGHSAHVKLTSPGGATMEKDGTTGLAVTPQPYLGVEVSIDLLAKGHGGRVRASGEADAIRASGVDNATAGKGNWTIEVSFAPLGPVPPQGVTGVALPSWTLLRANATPVAPVSR